MKKIAGTIYIGLLTVALGGGCRGPEMVGPSSYEYAPVQAGMITDDWKKEATPEFGEMLELGACLEYAALHNPGLEAAFYRWKEAVEQIPQEKALPDPEFRYGNYVRQSDMQMGQMAGVMQKFPWFGKLEAGGGAAAARAESARQDLEAAKLELYRQVKREFYEFLYLKEAIDIAEQNLELIQHFEQVALAKYTAATGSHPDIIRAQIELARLDEVLVSLRELKQPQTARLNALLNRPAAAELEWPQRPAFSQPNLDYTQLLEMLQEKNPQLAGMASMIEETKNQIKLAQKKFYPDLGVGVEWSQFEKSGGSSGRDAVALMFQINLPIWRGSYEAAERQARAAARSAVQQKNDTENRLAAQVAEVLYNLEESRRKIELYRQIIPKAEQLVSASETAYQADTVDFLSLIDSQRTLLQYNLDAQRMHTDYQQTLAELESVIGAELTP